MATVGDLFRKTARDDVIAAIEQLYPRHPGPRSGYERVWSQLIAMQPRPTKMKCVLRANEPPFVDVLGRMPHDPATYSISFVRWAEWLGMRLVVETGLALTEPEVLAHVLWEMTYAGYDEASIQSQYRELRALARAYRRREAAPPPIKKRPQDEGKRFKKRYWRRMRRKAIADVKKGVDC